jgi:hypothetical protein
MTSLKTLVCWLAVLEFAVGASTTLAAGNHISVSLANASGKSMSVTYTCSPGVAEKANFKANSKTVTVEAGKTEVLLIENCMTEYMAVKINHQKVLNNSIYGLKSGAHTIRALSTLDPKSPMEGSIFIQKGTVTDRVDSGTAR